MTSIVSYAFFQCSSLTTVTVHWEAPISIQRLSIPSISSATLIVPPGTKALYEAAEHWRDFGTIVERESEDMDEESEVVVTPSQLVDSKGMIDLSLNIPSDQTLIGMFTLTMPIGFNLDKENTVLAPELQNSHSLNISDKSTGVWTLEISANVSTRSASDVTYRKVVEIAYTIDENISVGDYSVKISDLNFTMSDNSTIKEDDIDVSVTYSTVGNALINDDVKVVCYNKTLSVSSLHNERVEIYSLAGTLVFSQQKPEGEVKYDISNLPKGIIIVRGSSGWVEKVLKK